MKFVFPRFKSKKKFSWIFTQKEKKTNRTKQQKPQQTQTQTGFFSLPLSLIYNVYVVQHTDCRRYRFFTYFTTIHISHKHVFCTVLKATKILTKGLSGSIDPYATIDFGKGKTHKTKVVYQTTNPEWNEYYTG